MGKRGWIGMTWPKQHGGHERSAQERYVVLEEMLAAGAPVDLHWIADRQSGPLILRVDTAEQKKILPGIAAGETYVCIGMSEPNAGSDLASVQTKAAKVLGWYLVNGTKVWTSFAHLSQYMILFCRTGPAGDNPAPQAALMKDLGAVLEQEIPEIARQLVDAEPDRTSTRAFSATLAHTMMHAPSFSLRGGAREISRGIIARGLGLR